MNSAAAQCFRLRLNGKSNGLVAEVRIMWEIQNLAAAFLPHSGIGAQSVLRSKNSDWRIGPN
jgi:hypothetical protein